jgi:hypothetical protein
MSDGKITINRTLVGVLAIGCLTAAVAIWIFAPTTEGEDNWEMWRGAFTRVGLLMSAFWLALPTSGREAAWANVTPSTFFGILLAIVALVRLPLKIVVPVGVLLAIVGAVLRPRPKKRPQNRP